MPHPYAKKPAGPAVSPSAPAETGPSPLAGPGASASAGDQAGVGGGGQVSQAGGVLNAGQEVSPQFPKIGTEGLLSADPSTGTEFDLDRGTYTGANQMLVPVVRADPTGLAPLGTVKRVPSGIRQDAVAAPVLAEVDELLAKARELAEAKELLESLPVGRAEKPHWRCKVCGFEMRGFDPSHFCDRSNLLRARAPKQMHEVLPAELKHSGRYRVLFWRKADGSYTIAEELIGDDGGIVALNVLDEGEDWGYVGARLLDLAVDKFTL